MTPEEFKKEATKRGISEKAIEKQLAIYHKFQSLGMQPTPLEAVLAAHDGKSCIRAFESALGH